MSGEDKGFSPLKQLSGRYLGFISSSIGAMLPLAVLTVQISLFYFLYGGICPQRPQGFLLGILRASCVLLCLS